VPRLLFDENLSPRLVHRLSTAFPGSQHVRDLGLRGCSDHELWTRAAQDGFVLVSKDNDFRQLSFMRGAPPKVIWIVIGNAGTERVGVLLEHGRARIEEFVADDEEALLILRLGA
jgi:predicted nuclease of predicted toxin-antitoxin system